VKVYKEMVMMHGNVSTCPKFYYDTPEKLNIEIKGIPNQYYF
jgi:hypothetical protein